MPMKLILSTAGDYHPSKKQNPISKATTGAKKTRIVNVQIQLIPFPNCQFCIEDQKMKKKISVINCIKINNSIYSVFRGEVPFHC